MPPGARLPKPAKAVPLKTIHTYPSKNGNASLNIYSYPQRVPTFMGGSSERGWGPLAGSVDIQVTDSSGERISAIKLILTATHITTTPKTASVDAPLALERMPIQPEETKTKEITLLHIERFLFLPSKTETDRNANLLSPGKHTFPFSIDLPVLGNKNKKNPPLLPPSCVIEPVVAGPNNVKLRSNSSLRFGRSKANSKDQNHPAWATVKYQLKLTIQRAGLLKRNLRCYAPFVYLPSPPSSSTSLLVQRRALGAQMAAIVLQRQGDGLESVETPDEWRQRSLSFLVSPNEPKVGAEKKTRFLSSLFSGSKKTHTVKWHEAWTFSMPMTGRSAFPLRSAIPFIVRCTTNKPIDLSLRSPLAFRLYRRVRFLSGRKQKAIAMQQEVVAEAALRYAVESRGVYRLNGVICLPPNCVPNFELHGLSLDYYVAIVRLLDGAVLHKEFVALVCPPPVEPKTAYGPFPSGAAWRNAQEPPPQDLSDGSLSLVHTPSALTASMSPALPARQRPSVTSIASSSSSSFPAASRRPSMTPSAKSHRSASTDSAHYASTASLPSHGNTSTAPSVIPMGLAGMARPPPASSAGASGLGIAQSSDYLDAVKEQHGTFTSAQNGPLTSPRDPSKRRASHGEGVMGAKETGDAASIASSRRKDRYSSKGAAPISAASSVGSSKDLDHRPDANRYVHIHEKTSHPSKDPHSASRASSSERGSGRPAVFATRQDNLPSIPAAPAASRREQANAQVGASSNPSRLSEKQRQSEQRGKQRGSPSRPVSAGTSSSNGRGAVVAPLVQTRRSKRPLPVAPAAPGLVHSTAPRTPPSPPPLSQQPSAVDPALLLTNDDLMYGEDMELDLPPSYFEAVYGAEEDDEDEDDDDADADEAHR